MDLYITLVTYMTVAMDALFPMFRQRQCTCTRNVTNDSVCTPADKQTGVRTRIIRTPTET